VLKGDSCAFEIEVFLPNFKSSDPCLILLEVLVSYTVEVKYHTNCRLWKLYPLLPFLCW